MKSSSPKSRPAKGLTFSTPPRSSRGGLAPEDPRSSAFKQFGGSLLKKGNPKTARHLSNKHAIHVVIKSSLAKGKFSLSGAGNNSFVKKALGKAARRYRVRIIEFANAGAYLQLLIQLKDKKDFAPFIRSVTGEIALKVLGANKNRSLQSILEKAGLDSHKGFWDFRPWTRLVSLLPTYRLAKDSFVFRHLQMIKIITHSLSQCEKYFREAPA